MEGFRAYLQSNHTQDLLQILQSTDDCKCYSVSIDFLKLFEADPVIGDSILCNSKNILPKCNKAVYEVQKEIYDEKAQNNENFNLVLKSMLRARFFRLPVCPELQRNAVPKNNDLGCFLKLTGTAVRLTQTKMLEHRKAFKCQRCQHVQIVKGRYEHRYVIKAPSKCNNSNMQCRSTTMTPIHEVLRDNCKDYQEMKVQEQVNKLRVGGIPGSICVTLEDDLVDCCKPGDDVSVCGTVTRRWRPVANNKKAEVEMVLRANHVEICNIQKSKSTMIAPDVKNDFVDFWASYKNSPMRGRDVILASICPKVYGLYMVKLALALTVITGCSYNEIENDIFDKSNTEKYKHSIRGQCHLLMVGDPGTGKSQLLKAAAALTPRSVLTSGSGSTKAGLTCTALKEDGEWQLEAGALVLADGGACCIDELAQMRETDRASIHEAMEQQTISVAKAGMICKLNTRCAVIAACNPKGNYETDQPLSINVSLGTPLLSRFDLIFILLDKQTRSWDEQVADYILFGNIVDNTLIKGWPTEKLQLYLSLIGPYEVTMTKSSVEILQAYYIRQRGAENRDPSRTTVRMLDSLVRLSQAHARLMNRRKVHTMDAVTAVTLMDLSMQDCILAGSMDTIQSTFQMCPDLYYLKSAKKLLSNLNLYEIWHDELLFYSNLLGVDIQQVDFCIENDSSDIFEKHGNISRINDTNSETVIESTYFKKPTINGNGDADSSDDDGGSQKEDINSKLLADSIKKVSSLHTKNNMLTHGLITGKKPRTRIKRNTNQKTTVVNKRKLNTPKGKKSKKAKNVDCVDADEINGDSEESDVEIDNVTMLNCLPSVNDPFHGLNMSFNIDDSDEESRPPELEKDIFTDSQKSNSSIVSVSKAATPSTSSINDSKSSINDSKSSFNDTKSSDKIKAALGKFAFVPRDKSANESCEHVNDSSDDSLSVLNISDGDKNAKPKSSVESAVPALNPSKLSKSLPTSQTSIFEDDDNLDCLDL